MYVYETQETFRLLVHLFSYVGEIGKLTPQIEEKQISNGLFLLGATLLDQEISFCTLGFSAEEEAFLAHEFRARKAKLEQADFIFLAGEKPIPLDQLRRFKTGDLIDPQNSATVIVTVKSFAETGKIYELAGPGIKETSTIHLPKEIQPLLFVRNELNQEYPLGIDLILLDEENQLICLPRTTQIKEVS